MVCFLFVHITKKKPMEIMELSSLFVYPARLTTFRVLLMEISVDLLALVLLYKFYSLYLSFFLSFSSYCDFKSINV